MKESSNKGAFWSLVLYVPLTFTAHIPNAGLEMSRNDRYIFFRALGETNTKVSSETTQWGHSERHKGIGQDYGRDPIAFTPTINWARWKISKWNILYNMHASSRNRRSEPTLAMVPTFDTEYHKYIFWIGPVQGAPSDPSLRVKSDREKMCRESPRIVTITI